MNVSWGKLRQWADPFVHVCSFSNYGNDMLN